MKLYFLRHGHAEDGFDKSDHDRQLTPEGIERMQTAAQVMARLNLNLKHIYSSPRVRALQTAEVVAQALNLQVEIREEVNFGFHAGLVKKMIAGNGADDSVMFVGHEPTMSETIKMLTGANADMKKGSLARVDVIGSSIVNGTLEFLISPKVFDALSGA